MENDETSRKDDIETRMFVDKVKTQAEQSEIVEKCDLIHLLGDDIESSMCENLSSTLNDDSNVQSSNCIDDTNTRDTTNFDNDNFDITQPVEYKNNFETLKFFTKQPENIEDYEREDSESNNDDDNDNDDDDDDDDTLVIVSDNECEIDQIEDNDDDHTMMIVSDNECEIDQNNADDDTDTRVIVADNACATDEVGDDDYDANVDDSNQNDGKIMIISYDKSKINIIKNEESRENTCVDSEVCKIDGENIQNYSYIDKDLCINDTSNECKIDDEKLEKNTKPDDYTCIEPDYELIEALKKFREQATYNESDNSCDSYMSQASMETVYTEEDLKIKVAYIEKEYQTKMTTLKTIHALNVNRYTIKEQNFLEERQKILESLEAERAERVAKELEHEKLLYKKERLHQREQHKVLESLEAERAERVAKELEHEKLLYKKERLHQKEQHKVLQSLEAERAERAAKDMEREKLLHALEIERMKLLEKENLVQQLTEQMQLLSLKRKKSIKDDQIAKIIHTSETNDIRKMELILVIKKGNKFYTFRRQFNSIMNILMEQEDVSNFICWFVADNSVQRYNDFKDMMRKNRPESIWFEYNYMSIAKDESDIIKMMIEYYKEEGMIAADVEVLKSIIRQEYKKPDEEPTTRTNIFLQKAYDITFAKHKEYINRKTIKRKK